MPLTGEPLVSENPIKSIEIGSVLPGIRTILVFAMNLLGDSICRLPAIAAAKRTYPESRIIVVTDPRYREVFEGQPFIDEVWAVDRTGSRVRQTIEWLRLVARARRARPNLVLDLYGSKRTALISRLIGARWRAGFHQSGMSRWYNLRPALQAVGRRLREARVGGVHPSAALGASEPRPQRHIIQQINAAVAPAGIEAEFRYVPIISRPPSPCTERGTGGEVSSERRKGGEVLLNPSARVEAKRWLAQRFGQLAARLGMRCAVITAPGDEALTEQVVSSSSGNAIALPAMTIKQLASLLSVAHLLITGDTGVLHLATAMGTPSVVLAGPTDPSLVAYPGCRQAILFYRDACSDWIGVEQCVKYNECRKSRCIDAISVDEVLAAARSLL